jgi:hypothetical protein
LLIVIRKFNVVIYLIVNYDHTVVPITDVGAVAKLAVNVK